VRVLAYADEAVGEPAARFYPLLETVLELDGERDVELPVDAPLKRAGTGAPLPSCLGPTVRWMGDRSSPAGTGTRGHRRGSARRAARFSR
jgi:hypothetical protein